jgi:hypothetical protein
MTATGSERLVREAIASSPVDHAEVLCPAVAAPSDDYWDEARRPLACLLFLMPLLVVYEVGVWWLAPLWNGIPRNGADAWLRGGLALAGLDAVWLLPAVVVGGLLAWHHRRRDPWRVSSSVLVGMLAESLLLAFALIIVGQTQDLVFQHCVYPFGESSRGRQVTVALPADVPDEYVPDVVQAPRPAEVPRRRHATARISATPLERPGLERTALVGRSDGVHRSGGTFGDSELRTPLAGSSSNEPVAAPRETTRAASPVPPSLWKQLAARTILFIGAGVYEEFLFRFLLIPGLILAFTKGGVPAGRAALLAVLWTSMLFSAAHYIGPAGDSFSMFTFLFRFAAGLFFATVFLSRGFGIVVGCHAAYDLLVGLMLPLAAGA